LKVDGCAGAGRRRMIDDGRQTIRRTLWADNPQDPVGGPQTTDNPQDPVGKQSAGSCGQTATFRKNDF